MLDILRAYQVEDVHKMVEKRRLINANEPGLGKTLETLMAIQLLEAKRVLVVAAPQPALGTWQWQTKKWLGEEVELYLGASHKRQASWKRFTQSNSRFLVTNYVLARELLAEKPAIFDTMVFDEYHLGGLMNHTTTTWKAVCKYGRCKNLFLLTGTPVRKGPQDLWAPLHLLDPYRFPSYWGFVGKYCITTKDHFGSTIEARPADPVKFKDLIDPYRIRRTKKKYLPELPDKNRFAVPLLLEGKQKQLYEQLENDMMIDTPETLIVSPNQAANIVRMRQVLITPRILGFNIRGAACDMIMQMADDEFTNGNPVSICTPYRQAIPFMIEDMEKLGAKVYVIHGGMGLKALTVSQMFQKDTNPRRVLIYTISSGASFDAYASRTGIFNGYEWSAINNKQAEDRLHRLGQVEQVSIPYLVHIGTIDEMIMAKLDSRQEAENWILDTDAVLANIKKRREQG